MSVKSTDQVAAAGEILNSLAHDSEGSDQLSDSEELLRMERMLEQFTTRQ